MYNLCYIITPYIFLLHTFEYATLHNKKRLVIDKFHETCFAFSHESLSKSPHYLPALSFAFSDILVRLPPSWAINMVNLGVITIDSELPVPSLDFGAQLHACHVACIQ